MALPSPAELREMLVTNTFHSEAFIVAKGQKTPYMLEVEQQKIADYMAAKAASGQPPTAPPTLKDPDPATPALADKLAGVLKYFCGQDVVLLTKAKVDFKAHFAGVLTNGVLVLYPLCDAIFDAAIATDVPYPTLKKLGMSRYGEPLGIETLGKWVKSKTYASCMPNGDLADDYVALITLLKLDPELVGGKLEWNEMDCCITIDRVRIEDAKTTSDIRVAIGSTYSVPTGGKRGNRRFVPSETNVQQAIEAIARGAKYHPAREWFEKTVPVWDTQDHFLDLLKAIGGYRDETGLTGEVLEWTKKTNALALSQTLKTFIGTVARTFVPGCQMDTMWVLKSKQGTKKSSLFRTLAPAGRFSDTHIDFGSKDSRMTFVQNTWVEIAELSSMQRKEVGLVKQEITTRSDDFRLPFGKHMTKNPRWCVMMGSTNDDTFLKDQTGSRRVWIIVVDDRKINIMYIETITPQLWAQALFLYRAADTCADCKEAKDGETRCPTHRWWLSLEEDELREEFNQQFTEEEPYVNLVKAWMQNAITDKKVKQGMHVKAANTDALRIDEALAEIAGLTGKDCHDMLQQKRMAFGLKANGYVKKHTNKGNYWISPQMQGRPELTVVPDPPKDEPTKEVKEALETVDPLKPTGEGSK